MWSKAPLISSRSIDANPLTHRRLNISLGWLKPAKTSFLASLSAFPSAVNMPTDGWRFSAECGNRGSEDASITKGKVLKCKTLLKTEEDALLIQRCSIENACSRPAHVEEQDH